MLLAVGHEGPLQRDRAAQFPASALGKASRKPSPRSSTSRPPWASQVVRTISLWADTTRCAARSPSRSVMIVKSAMSLNMSVTVPSDAAALERSGRLASTDEAATTTIDAFTLLDSLPCARIFRVRARSSHWESAPMRR